MIGLIREGESSVERRRRKPRQVATEYVALDFIDAKRDLDKLN